MPELLIVGAGPAGLAAAAKATDLGLECWVVDENRQTGGQYYRRSPWAPSASVAATDRWTRGLALEAKAQSAAVFHLGCSVVGLDDDLRLWIDRGDRLESVSPKCLLLATGAHDRPIAFPGWTLPGVMSSGAAQVLVKAQGMRPGSRAVIAGVGPFNYLVATHLLEAGVEVAAIVEAATVRHSASSLPAAMRYPERLRELTRYVAQLAKARVRIRTGEMVASAHGAARLEAVTLRPVGDRKDGSRSAHRTVDADLLCVGYGFAASTELARLAGCALIWDQGLSQRVPAHDEWQATSADRVYVAGEAGGLGGVNVAEAEGELAAIGCALHLGHISRSRADSLARPIWRRLRRLRRFAALLPRIFPVPGKLAELVQPETIVCRCENVTYRAVRDAVELHGATSLNELKTTTRCGQGWCQGRICGSVLPPLMARYGVAFDSNTELSVRNPIRPISVASALAAP